MTDADTFDTFIKSGDVDTREAALLEGRTLITEQEYRRVTLFWLRMIGWTVLVSFACSIIAAILVASGGTA